MDRAALIKITDKPLSRRGMVNVKKLAWAINRNLESLSKEILRKHCDVKSPPVIVCTKTGQVGLKYNPFDVEQDYFL